ncbi:MAG: D-alanyl-D-alanine dipeptidase [Alloprevotella sp.]|nr:D-alanyl-D-alanine dipeptidase [Alloprevotella sp.]
MKKISLLALLMLPLAVLAQRPSATGQQLEAAGLVRIQDTDPSIRERLVLATPENFAKKAFYKDMDAAYLHPQAALALKKAQAALKRLRPELSLLVLDAARPMSVQGLLYAEVVGTNSNIYVSDPRSGGDQHNYGLAVDVTLCNAETGDTLQMGTLYGAFEPLSGQAAEDAVSGEAASLTPEAVANRRLLRRVMAAGGFKALRTEWWHFNFRTRSEAKANFSVLR